MNEIEFDAKGNLWLDGKKVLYKKVRGKKGDPIGIVVAIDKNRIGFSKCHSQLDRFHRDEGLYIAIRRAIKGRNYEELTKKIDDKEQPFIPHALINDYQKMKERAASYFK